NQIREMFGRDFNPEDETQAGEYYIDSVGVHPDRQGEGIGSKVFEFLINTYLHERKQTVGLLVDKDNPTEKSLYLTPGFKSVGDKTLAGKELEHMQYNAGWPVATESIGLLNNVRRLPSPAHRLSDCRNKSRPYNGRLQIFRPASESLVPLCHC